MHWFKGSTRFLAALPFVGGFLTYNAALAIIPWQVTFTDDAPNRPPEISPTKPGETATRPTSIHVPPTSTILVRENFNGLPGKSVEIRSGSGNNPFASTSLEFAGEESDYVAPQSFSVSFELLIKSGGSVDKFLLGLELLNLHGKRLALIAFHPDLKGRRGLYLLSQYREGAAYLTSNAAAWDYDTVLHFRMEFLASENGYEIIPSLNDQVLGHYQTEGTMDPEDLGLHQFRFINATADSEFHAEIKDIRTES